MSTTHLEDLTLASRNATFSFVSDAFVAKSWARTIINSDVSTPTIARQAVREEAFRSPGNSNDVGGFYVFMRVFFDSSANTVSIMLYGCTAVGEGGFVAISTATRSGTTVTIDTVTPHLMTTGDLVVVNGITGAENLNECNGGTSTAHNTITVTGASQFTYTSATSGAESETGGICFAVFNLTSAITPELSGPLRLSVTDATNDFRGAIDEHGIAGVVQQGADTRFMYLGSAGRAGNVPAKFSQTFTSTNAIVGSGAIQTIDVDQVPALVRVGQRIDIVDSESARIFRATLAVIGPGNALQIDVDIGEDFAAGAHIGWDPMPVAACGANSNSLLTATLDALNWHVAYGVGAQRTWAQTDPVDARSVYDFAEPQVSANNETVSDTSDVNSGSVRTFDIEIVRTSATELPLQGARGPLLNMIGCITANQVDFDFAVTGDAVVDDYKMCVPQQCTGVNDHVAFGPNAPGAPAI